jgi:phosphatidate cytidylyltransferase
MKVFADPGFTILLVLVFTLLLIFTLIGNILHRRQLTEQQRATVNNLQLRTKSWWSMCIVFILSVMVGKLGSILLFLFISFLALREFITITPTVRSDHRTLFYVFFILTPLQLLLVGVGWYGLFSILIPVYGFLFIPLRMALSENTENFFARAAKIQWGLMVCVYCISHAPALLMLDIPNYEDQNFKLLFFLMLVVQSSDVFQYVCGKLFGSRKIVPQLSPNKTWEGFLGGTIIASLIGAGLYWITPFGFFQTLIISFIITLAGFAGGLCMSAIKRDRGIKDFGNMIEGHGGMLDRMDSIVFAAPIFFHLVRYFYT